MSQLLCHVFFKGIEVETEVRRPRNQKAAAIELKMEEKPTEKAENAYFETEEYKVSSSRFTVSSLSELLN